MQGHLSAHLKLQKPNLKFMKLTRLQAWLMAGS